MTVNTAQTDRVSRSGGSGPSEVLQYGQMQEISRSKRNEYANAQPYPHTIIDGFFDEWTLDRVLEEFPRPTDKNWTKHDIPEEVKLQSTHERLIPLFTRQFLYSLNSASFLQFLEELTGIEKLISDPQFEGGGLHQIPAGGKLAIHADFNKHSYYGLNRRLNMLIYLNKNWKEEYGGHFELWDRDMSRMVTKVAPLFNRVVIFSTSRFSYHGHPDPLKCPASVTRKSLALYYYTVASEPNEVVDGRHSTLFQKRPGEHFSLSGKHLARDLTPPILWRSMARIFGS
jgi:Rps23 Pro-64 3,4-dihydroxylase Tpa1-like proline 4-hydroxylase